MIYDKIICKEKGNLAMKRFVAVLSSLLVLPAFAEVAPITYDEFYDEEVADYVDDSGAESADMAADETTTVVEKSAPVVQPSRRGVRTTANSGRSVSRVLPSSVTNANNVSKRTASAARVMPSSRTATTQRVAARTATTQNAQSRGTVSRTATRSNTRVGATAAQQIAQTRRAMQGAPSVNSARASIVQTDTVNTPLYTGRVAMRSGAVRARVPSAASAVSASSVVTETVEETAVSMDELAQITDFCKAQYTQCMDNYCNVLDDNQGRCSCSKNLKNYAKTEEALKAATEALQDVAQQIQYIGLTGDEVEILFTQTVAEDQMQSSSDNTQLKSDLDKIKNLIVDVKTGSASSTETGMSFDLSGLLDFSVDSTGFDLSSLFGGGQANTSSISNQRGEQLYKTATARCKAAVLSDCQSQGVDISIITNAYDLEIDKQCLAYERKLTDSNEEMGRTVRNAKSVLQRARLMVAQNKNVYQDMRSCVNALDSCMQDDFVCGTDYENCIDPSGKYIVNGEVVVGSMPGQSISESDPDAPGYYTDGLYATWNYGEDKNAWDSKGKLEEFVNATVTAAYPTESGENMSTFLQNKIGYNNSSDGRNYGMCISELNKCQNLTYDSDGKYKPDNPVVKEYLRRTLIQIKNMQDNLLASYAENCIPEVKACLTQNGFDFVDHTSDKEPTKSTATNNVAMNACRQQIVTCMSVNGDAEADPTPNSMLNWVNSATGATKAPTPES